MAQSAANKKRISKSKIKRRKSSIKKTTIKKSGSKVLKKRSKKNTVTYIKITGKITRDEGEPEPAKERLLLIGFAAMLVFIAILLSNIPEDLDENVTLSPPEDIYEQLAGSGNSMFDIINEGTVDSEKIESLSEADYNEIKRELGVTGDFAIYFVDEDNNILLIGDTTCIGSPDAKVGGTSCGEKFKE